MVVHLYQRYKLSPHTTATNLFSTKNAPRCPFSWCKCDNKMAAVVRMQKKIVPQNYCSYGFIYSRSNMDNIQCILKDIYYVLMWKNRLYERTLWIYDVSSHSELFKLSLYVVCDTSNNSLFFTLKCLFS